MSIKKYSLLTIMLYLFAFLTPAFFTTTEQKITAVTMSYLSGAVALIILYLQQTEQLSFEKKSASWRAVMFFGLAGIFAAIVLQNLVLQVEQLFVPLSDSQNTQGIIETIRVQPLFSIAVALGAPVMEEFVFRRAFTGLLTNYLNVWLAFIISSCAFALIHQDGHLLVYFSLGMLFSLLYHRTGKIWTPILAHVGMNTLVVLGRIFL